MPMPERHKTGKWEEGDKENDFRIMIYLSQYEGLHFVINRKYLCTTSWGSILRREGILSSH